MVRVPAGMTTEDRRRGAAARSGMDVLKSIQVGTVKRQSSSLALSDVPAKSAGGCARAWTKVIVTEWRLAALSEAAELIVSELATNAVRASRDEGVAFFRLILTHARGEVAILVRDFCSGLPQPREAGQNDEGGRGLLLVQAMSRRSGWYPPDSGPPGKFVYAVLSAD
jgi:anti-sigma regulatory factor (Ser/Thr protein kinase)